MEINEEKQIYYSNTTDSEYVTYSDEVYHSRFVHYSKNIIDSTDVIDSSYIRNSSTIYDSSFVNDSDRIVKSNNISDSTNIVNSSNIFGSIDIFGSNTIYNSQAVTYSEGCDNIYHCTSCKNVHNSLFCANLEDAAYRIFNKEVEPQHFEAVLSQMKLFFDNAMRLHFMSAWEMNTSGKFQYDKCIAPPIFWYNKVSDDFVNWAMNLPNYDDTIMNIITSDIRFIKM